MKEKKPFKCDICCSTFSQKINLKSHVSLVHEGKMPFKCQMWHLWLWFFSLLKVHEKKKPFKCDACSASFRSNQDLNRHMVSIYEAIQMCCLLLCLFTKIHFEDTCVFSSWRENVIQVWPLWLCFFHKKTCVFSSWRKQGNLNVLLVLLSLD